MILHGWLGGWEDGPLTWENGMGSNPCGKCGRHRGTITATCPNCGHTQWWLIGLCFIGGLLSLTFGVAALFTFATYPPSSDGTAATLAALLFVAMGLLFFVPIVTSIRHLRKRRGVEKDSGPARKESPPPPHPRTQTKRPTQAKPGGPTAGGGPAKKPDSQSVQTEPARWAYMVPGPGAVTEAESDEKLKQLVREKAAGMGLDVVFHSPEEWDAPTIASSTKEEVTAAFSTAPSRAQAHMAKMGLPPIDTKELMSTADALANPDSGTLIFVFQVQQPVKSNQPSKPPVERGDEPESPGPMMPNDALRSLRSRVEQLSGDHPRRQDAMVDPKLDKQLPWISQTLEQAASALESEMDSAGNPITNTQVIGGLRTLMEMVRDPNYLTTMDMGHPGIAASLRGCMDQLETIVGGMERGPETAPGPSKGVDTLVELCTGMGILFPDGHVTKAVGELREEGDAGSRALAVLLRELLACRSPKITHALEVAGQVNPLPELVEAIRAVAPAVAAASELTEAPADPRFQPEIVGDGRVGWTSGTYSKVIAAARKAEASLESRD